MREAGWNASFIFNKMMGRARKSDEMRCIGRHKGQRRMTRRTYLTIVRFEGNSMTHRHAK